MSSASLRAIGPIVPLPEQAAVPSFETSPTQLSPQLSAQLSPPLSPPLPTQLPAALARAPQADGRFRTFEYESCDEADLTRRSRLPRLACGSLAALAVAVGAYLIGHRGEEGGPASAA
ncbi:hypothetical protein, partial [Paraburkholderia sp.]|uniref:hypothetical protein n=1 Tax=Paraburkholderia sp. TaxID=1926495 RepID=UPI00286EC709